MPKGSKAKKIVPFNKTAPTESIDKIPETASLDDYEKMISKLANSSDDIIDGALDKLEGKKPTAHTPVKEEAKEDYPKQETKEEVKVVHQENQSVVNELLEKLKNANQIVESLKSENEELKKKVSSSENNSINASMFRDELSKLTDKNDNLILKNSELEFEISRLGAENLRLKTELEKLSNAKRLPPQTNSREGYTRVNQNQLRNVGNSPVGVYPRRPPRMSTNGYEYWT